MSLYLHQNYVVTYALVSDEHAATVAQWLPVVPGGRVTTSRTVAMTRDRQCPGGLNRRGTTNQTHMRGITAMIHWQHITNDGVLAGDLELTLDLDPHTRWRVLAATAYMAITHERVMTALGILNGDTLHMCDCEPCRKTVGALVVIPDVVEARSIVHGHPPLDQSALRKMADGRYVFTYHAGTGCWA